MTLRDTWHLWPDDFCRSESQNLVRFSTIRFLWKSMRSIPGFRVQWANSLPKIDSCVHPPSWENLRPRFQVSEPMPPSWILISNYNYNFLFQGCYAVPILYMTYIRVKASHIWHSSNCDNRSREYHHVLKWICWVCRIIGPEHSLCIEEQKCLVELLYHGY